METQNAWNNLYSLNENKCGSLLNFPINEHFQFKLRIGD